MTASLDNDALDGIAIIGMAGRFPGARTVEAFWQNLRAGVESIRFFSEAELAAAGVDASAQRRPGYVPAHGALPDIDRFDAAFFGYNPREADLLDPQQRLFLECAWEALERAGYAPAAATTPVGVYAGASMSTYLFHLAAHPEASGLLGGLPMVIGHDKDHLATRVSYKLNLTGPSVSIQTACSTSLVATVMACQGLLNYQCDLALAGGVCVTAPQAMGYVYEEGGVQSPDGHCRAFDARAAGAVPGNGVGIVVLKRLAEAQADGDHIHAVIKGFAVNNDGADKVGYTAPSVEGQAKVIATALAIADFDPTTISYVEAHGTGTPLGDPIELAALRRAFQSPSPRARPCAIGSVKTNIGHLDAAAGVAGLIKTALALEHRELPPSLHFERPNPQLKLEESPFYVNSCLAPWPAGASPRRAGVSSFGIGGTNAHVVLEEAPARQPAAAGRPAHLLVWSAKTEQALDAATADLEQHLREHPDANLADVAYTLQVGRTPFAHRRLLVSEETSEAAGALAAGRVLSGAAEERERPVAFLFPGQGAQYPNMGLGLYQHEPAFRDAVDRCCDLLLPHLGLDLRAALFPPAERLEAAARDLAQTALAQPALFVVEYALATLWEAWGVRPTALLGHSLGEYVAATLAGVFTLEDALALTAERGRLMQALPPGAMLAVPLAEADLCPLLGDDLALAAVNGPALCVAAGPEAAIRALEERLAAQGVSASRLRTSHAFHSAAMDPILDEFRAQVGRVALHAPQLPYLANVTGTWADAAVTDPAYWVRHLRQTVRFADGVQALLRDPERVLLEVGPGTTLSRLAAQHPAWTGQHVAAASLRHPRERQTDSVTMLSALGRLWLAGLPVDWSALHRHERRQRVVLPAYPFARERHWVDAPGGRALATAGPPAAAPARRLAITDWFSVPSWRRLPPPRAGAALDGCSLIFTDQHGLGNRLAARLIALGSEVVTVTPGDAFATPGPGAYRLRPAERGDYRVLLERLGREGKAPRRIVHLWGVDGDVGAPLDEGRFAAAQERSYLSLLCLAQVLSPEQPAASRDVVVVTAGGQAVRGDEQLRPEVTTVLGAGKVIAQERPDLRWRAVDVEIKDAPADAERIIGQLLAELADQGNEPVLALRGEHRWAQTYEPLPLAATTPAAARLRPGGVYLITGGLGGIGLTLAAHLAKAVQARLVLVGRTPLPERERWDEWLASHGDSDPVGAKIRALLELDASGATVLPIAADVADRAQMRAAVERAVDRFGRLDGVIHGAGLTAPDALRPVEATDRDLSWVHFRPKALGLLALDDALEGQQPDFCLLLSSLSAVLGGLGMTAYAAANQFMDAYAARSAQGAPRRWTSVNWDGWNLSRDEAGAPDRAITRAEGVDACMRILAAPPAPQIVVSTGDLRVGLERWLRLTPLRSAPAEPAQAAALHPRPPVAQEYVEPRDAVERAVAELWQELLGIESVGVHDSFFELGGHSLLAVQLSSRLRARFQVDISVQGLFDGPTVAETAAGIRAQLGVGASDADGVIEALSLVGDLSDDEVRALLAQSDRAAREEA